jgi:hypothetical protein
MLGEIVDEANSLLRCYPQFVLGRCKELEPGEIPVFVFHTIVPEELETQLRYLQDNGYTTLSLDEFLATVAGTRKPSPREVLLTFDDARSSFWLYGFPVLKKYGAKATLFAITGWTPDTPARPNLDDVDQGTATREELAAIDPDDREICSWEELRHMHASGLVTVDSHSHLHRHVFTEPRLVSAIRPNADFSPSNSIQGPYLSHDAEPRRLPPDYYVGLPLFPIRAFLQDGPAIRVDADACAGFKSAARELAETHPGSIPATALADLGKLLPDSAISVVAPERLEAEMREDLSLARKTLRNELRDADAGRSLCIPFSLGGSMLVRVARDIGIEGLFWGVSRDARINTPGHDPLRLVRLKNDFIFRLPGKNRESLGAVYLAKFRRRLAGERPY